MSMQEPITLTLQSIVEEIYQSHPSITKEVPRRATQSTSNRSVACSICYLELILNSTIPERLIMKRRSIRRHYELTHPEHYDIIPKVLNVFFYAVDDNGNINNNIQTVDELYNLFRHQRQLMVEAEKKKEQKNKQKKKLKANQCITNFFGKNGDDKKEEENTDDDDDINHSLPSHDNDVIIPSPDNDDNNNRNHTDDDDEDCMQSQDNDIDIDTHINHNNNDNDIRYTYYPKSAEYARISFKREAVYGGVEDIIKLLSAYYVANAPQSATESKQKKMAQRDQDRYHKERGRFEMESVTGDGLSKHHHNETTILKVAFKCAESGKNPFCDGSMKEISPVMDRRVAATKPFESTIPDIPIRV